MTTAPLPEGRLVSLDAFRGLTIAGMILVNNPGIGGHLRSPPSRRVASVDPHGSRLPLLPVHRGCGHSLLLRQTARPW